MKKIEVQTTILQYDSAAELSTADALLLRHAQDALRLSYSPYSRFQVGAAVHMQNGEILEGANYENAAYPLCICAEQSLLAAASARFPGIAVESLAITIHSETKNIDRPAAPCGACRQVICETEQKNKQSIRVILQGETGPIVVIEKGSDLLPLAFDGSFLPD